MISELNDLNKIITGLLERAKNKQEIKLLLKLLDELNKIKLAAYKTMGNEEMDFNEAEIKNYPPTYSGFRTIFKKSFGG